jgi:hypothetical protein
MNKIHFTTIALALVAFGASMWVEFYKPFRDLGVARSGIPELVCLAAFSIALIATTASFYSREKRIRESLIPTFGVSLTFGATAWIVERIFYFNYWKYSTGQYFLIGAAIGGIIFLTPLVIVKLIQKLTEPVGSGQPM